jgi:hypothetical protein
MKKKLEIIDFIITKTLSKEEQEIAKKELAKARKKVQASLTEQDRLEMKELQSYFITQGMKDLDLAFIFFDESELPLSDVKPECIHELEKLLIPLLTEELNRLRKTRPELFKKVQEG